MQKLLIAVSWLLVVGCIAHAEPPATVTLPAASVAFYRKAFAEAQGFVPKSIPAAMLPPLDRGNNVYYEVYSGKHQLLGYLRDFSGPVSPADACPCNPLNLTLAFNPDRSLRSLIAPVPLQKYGHAPLSEAEHEHLVSILKAPPKALLAVRRVEDMVDATSGATKLPLAALVVPQAALSTRRLAGVVKDSQDILRGAPAGRDRQRLHAVLTDKTDKAAQLSQAQGIAALLPSLESPDLKRQAYYLMGTSYLGTLTPDAAADAGVESALLQPGLAQDTAGADVAAMCYRFADKGLRLDFVRACIAALTQARGTELPPGALALLRGTERLAAGDATAALPDLREASRRFTVSAQPELHLRLSQAYVKAGQAAAGCKSAERLYAEHSLIPGLQDALQACVAPDRPLLKVLADLNQAARSDLLRRSLPTSPAAEALSVETATGQSQEVALYEPGKVTVAVFFATWCPHCRAELPRVKAFVDLVNSRPEWRDRVRVLGVRTAVEKEAEPYDTFRSAVSPNFPIFTDATLSLAFSHFAKTTGIPAALPTTAILDDQGSVRFFLEPGDFRDTKSELTWAVESLLPRLH